MPKKSNALFKAFQACWDLAKPLSHDSSNSLVSSQVGIAEASFMLMYVNAPREQKRVFPLQLHATPKAYLKELTHRYNLACSNQNELYNLHKKMQSALSKDPAGSQIKVVSFLTFWASHRDDALLQAVLGSTLCDEYNAWYASEMQDEQNWAKMMLHQYLSHFEHATLDEYGRVSQADLDFYQGWQAKINSKVWLDPKHADDFAFCDGIPRTSKIDGILDARIDAAFEPVLYASEAHRNRNVHKDYAHKTSAELFEQGLASLALTELASPYDPFPEDDIKAGIVAIEAFYNHEHDGLNDDEPSEANRSKRRRYIRKGAVTNALDTLSDDIACDRPYPDFKWMTSYKACSSSQDTAQVVMP